MPTNQFTKTHSYLLFKIGEESFAANVTKVEGILELTKITKIPRVQKYVLGVINLRGAILPIVDIKIKFGMEKTLFTSNTCILILEIQLEGKPVKIGALVDSVVEVLEINEDEILPRPSLGNNYRSEFIYGMYRVDDSFIMLLDVDTVFSSNELSSMSTEMLFDEDMKIVE